MVRLAERLFKWSASLPLAIGVVAALAIALALGTWLESRFGAAVAHTHVYQSTWFCGLLTVFAINVMASALIRYPWTRGQAGFVIVHLGIEILLAGSLIGARFGFDAQVHLSPGQSTSTIQTDRDRLVVAVPNGDAVPVGYEIPLDMWAQSTWSGHWPEARKVALPEAGDAKFTIVNWLPSARADASRPGEFCDAPVAPGDLSHATKAILISINYHGQTFRRWVVQGSVTSINVRAGDGGSAIRLAYAPAEQPLPFSLSVASVGKMDLLAGNQAGYAIDVVFEAPNSAASRQSVQINHPASFDGVSVFAGPVDEKNAAGPRATLDVRRDPGWPLKYVGVALIVAGTIGVFTLGSVETRKRRANAIERGNQSTLVPAAA